MQAIFYTLVFIIGACLGSFLCCQVRRLRLKEEGKKSLGKRSVCPFCKHKLKWYENLPILSWLIQKGRCKKCRKKIGVAEILSEILTGLALLGITMSFFQTEQAFFTTSVLTWIIFAVIILFVLTLIFIAIYDGLYGELPCLCLTFAAICAIIIVSIRLWNWSLGFTVFSWEPVFDILWAVLILGGTYLLLYLVSKGKWVGDGDWLLSTIIAAVLGTPWTALIALFIANFSASLIMYPIVRKKKNHTIYFGPFLVFAFILTLILSNYGIINL